MTDSTLTEVELLVVWAAEEEEAEEVTLALNIAQEEVVGEVAALAVVIHLATGEVVATECSSRLLRRYRCGTGRRRRWRRLLTGTSGGWSGRFEWKRWWAWICASGSSVLPEALAWMVFGLGASSPPGATMDLV